MSSFWKVLKLKPSGNKNSFHVRMFYLSRPYENMKKNVSWKTLKNDELHFKLGVKKSVPKKFKDLKGPIRNRSQKIVPYIRMYLARCIR